QKSFRSCDIRHRLAVRSRVLMPARGKNPAPCFPPIQPSNPASHSGVLFQDPLATPIVRIACDIRHRLVWESGLSLGVRGPLLVPTCPRGSFQTSPRLRTAGFFFPSVLG